MTRYYKDDHRYDDIINLPHHQSKERPHMSLHDRAAQFAPFAALTGHEDAIKETARLTENELLLDESIKAEINNKINGLSKHLSEKWNVSVTYFKPDEKKTGGAYLTDIGVVKKINEAEKILIMDSGMKIQMEQIYGIEIEK